MEDSGSARTIWRAEFERLAGTRERRLYRLFRGPGRATAAEVFAGWREDPGFARWFSDLLAEIPFSAFRWETPAVTEATQGRPFEFVVTDSPGLARFVDSDVFADDERAVSGIMTIPNLGGDAILVVPRAWGDQDAYGHLGAFVRGAPAEQRVALWHAVGHAMEARVGVRPVWLSTAGGGVAWLHVRLDDQPKYYDYAPYRELGDDGAIRDP